MQSDYIITNSKIRILAHILYYLSGTAYVLAGQLDIDWLRSFKIVPLVILFLLILPSKMTLTIYKIIAGLVCGAAGDLVLQYEGSTEFFSIGALFFLLGHVMYNLAILDLWEIKKQHRLFNYKLLIILGSVLLLSGSFINLSTTITDKMRDQNFPMLFLMPVYLIFLTFNCINAYLLLLAQRHVDRHHVLLFLGTILFCISDNLLGRAIFDDFRILGSRKINSIVIMGTYYLGQHMMVLNIAQIWYSQRSTKKQARDRQSLLTQTQ